LCSPAGGRVAGRLLGQQASSWTIRADEG
jgi:hypothetical protein